MKILNLYSGIRGNRKLWSDEKGTYRNITIIYVGGRQVGREGTTKNGDT